LKKKHPNKKYPNKNGCTDEKQSVEKNHLSVAMMTWEKHLSWYKILVTVLNPDVRDLAAIFNPIWNC